MIVLLDHKGFKLVQRYNIYYIRFTGGQMAETICEFQITDAEADEILFINDKIIEIKNIYKKKISWTMNTFINIGIHDYIQYECGMSEKRIESNMKQLDLHSDIKHEFYKFIMTEEFPVNSAIEVNGYTARRLKRMAKEIKNFKLQPRYLLQEEYVDMQTGKKIRAIYYKSDFEILHNDGSKEVVEIKGYQTQVYKLKIKMFKLRYPDLKLTVI